MTVYLKRKLKKTSCATKVKHKAEAVPVAETTVSDDSKQNGYDVGYGKPPKHSQFQKGSSGNPKGRPKGNKNIDTLLEEALSSEIIITENGKSRHVQKKEAMFIQLINKALNGNMAAVALIIEKLGEIEAKHAASMSSQAELNRDDVSILDQFLKRVTEKNHE